MKKRVMAALFAAMLSVSSLAGCGSTETGAETPAASEEKAPAESTEAAEEEAEAEAPAADDGETVTVKWLFPIDKAEDHDLVMEDLNKKIKEKINVELELICVPQGEYNDKVTLAATSGEDFDLMFTATWLNPFATNIARDGLLPLDDLVAEYGQDMMASMPDWLPEVAKVDGKLYAIPNQQIIAKQYGVIVQKEYADKYGFDLTSMKDISEFYPFLDEVAANEPTLFPIDQRQSMVLAGYEDLVGGVAFIKNGDKDANVVSIVDIIGEQDKMDKEWYDKGYIREDIATVTDNSADVKANRYVSTIGTYKPGWGAEQSARNGAEYIDVPIEGAYVGAMSGAETMTAINVNSKHPEEAMKLLNLVYTDKEIFNELLFGIEGTHYTKTGENSVEPVADSKYNYGSQAWKFGNQFLAWTLPGQADDVWEKTAALNESAEVSPLRGFTFNPENVQAELAQISAVMQEYKNMQYQAEDIEKFTAEKCEKLNQAGVQTVVDEVQRQVDEFLGK